MTKKTKIEVRLSDKQKEQIEEAAKKANLTMSEWILDKCFPVAYPKAAPYKAGDEKGDPSMPSVSKLPSPMKAVLADLKAKNDELGELCSNCKRKGLTECSRTCIEQRKADAARK